MARYPEYRGEMGLSFFVNVPHEGSMVQARNKKRPSGQSFWLVRKLETSLKGKGIWVVFRLRHLADGSCLIIGTPRQVRTQRAGLLWVEIQERMRILENEDPTLRVTRF